MIKKMLLVFLCLSLILSIPACKKKLPSSPDIPAVITPTVQSITVTSNSDLLYIGESETFTATATMSDGSTKTVTGGAWSGDNPSVATVGASTGEVTIVGSGTVNISVAYNGKTGSKAIRGLPNYQGTWSGTYYILSCNATGDFATMDFCSYLPPGTELPIELNLVQDDDRVEGRFYLGDLGADTSGPVGTDGQLILAGAIQEGTATIEAAMSLQSVTPGEITGNMNQIWRDAESIGSARIEANIQNLPRISTMAMPLRSVSRMLTPTLQDLMRALLRR